MQQAKHTDTDLELYHADALWFGEHYKELRSLYPDQWVAVYRKKVVGADEDAELLISNLHSRNVPIENTYFKFMPSKDEVWAFTATR